MTLFETATILALVIVLAATFFRSIFGFGEALIAMPLLSMDGVIGLDIARPYIALLSVGIAISILIRDWRHVEWRSAGVLAISSIVGIPLGVFGLSALPESTVKVILATVIILFSLFRLTKLRAWRLQSDRSGVIFGFIGGLLGGAYNVTGPPLVMFGTLRHWTAQQFRATLQGVFLPSSIVIAASHGINGGLTRDVWFLWAISLPVLVIGVYAGRWVNRRVRAERFVTLVYYLLIAIGLLLLWEQFQSK